MPSSTQIVPGMLGVYNELLAKNVANYQNVLGAYGTGQQTVANALPGISGAYGRINDEAQNMLGMGAALGKNGNWGIATPAAEAIRDTLMQNQAANDQGMISRGLGNSTIRSNVSGQLASDAARAYGNLGSQLADRAAGVRTQIGLAQQAAQMQGLGLQTQLSQAMGGALANYHFSNTAGGLLGGFSSDGGGAGHAGGGAAPTSYMPNSQVHFGNSIASPGASGYGSDTRYMGGYAGGSTFGGINYGQNVSLPGQGNGYPEPGTGLQMGADNYPPAGTARGEGWGVPGLDGGADWEEY